VLACSEGGMGFYSDESGINGLFGEAPHIVFFSSEATLCRISGQPASQPLRTADHPETLV